MSTTLVTNCDVCGTAKKDVNHWWKMWINGSKILSVSAASNSHASPPAETAIDVCGSNCASKVFQRFLTNQTLHEDTVTETCQSDATTL